MILHFYLRYSTRFGQTIFVTGNTPALGNDDPADAFALEYLNDQLWHGQLTIDDDELGDSLQYKYFIRQNDGPVLVEYGDDRIIAFSEYKANKLELVDTWNHPGTISNVFFTAPFQEVLLKGKAKQAKNAVRKAKKFTHEFRVKAPLLQDDSILAITGSSAELHEWDEERIIPMSKEGNWWKVKLDLTGSVFPLAYKYVLCKKDKQFLQYEEGNNRILLEDVATKKQTVLHDGFADIRYAGWKGAGVAIPVFSLRTKNGFGTGEFNDITMLVDWAEKTGLKMIQLLPVNDTTSTHTWKDSYPYSAISAFALHPLYLNLETVAGEDAHIVKALAKKKKQLNSSPDVEYDQVVQFKLNVIKELYALQKDLIKEDFDYFRFFDLNRHWLVPYAAYCYLRDKYGTSEFSTWRSNSIYDEEAIQRLVSPSQPHYDEIAIHYYTQYHLHKQLEAATNYAHKKGVIIKGDIPIGIGRTSVDAWMEPGLYHMEMQAGAPPDDFSIKGQNWGFPTYNWHRMQEDDFAWWRKRFEQMGNYFDAFRIDHILGFFRIWSIPVESVEGIMGRFVPAIPVSINEFFEKRISFELHRYTKPFFNDGILAELFGEDREEVESTFFNGEGLKEAFNTQRKVEQWFQTQDKFGESVKQGLFEIISNVILFEEEGSEGQKFHFRIAMDRSSSFHNLDEHSQKELRELYVNYFYQRQDDIWKGEAMNKLPALKRQTNMLICGEDLGMVPHCVPEVMEDLGILSLEIQRMPKKTGSEFFHPKDAPYMSVVSPSTHDMSTVRGWWEEDKAKTDRFYNQVMNHPGPAPQYCEPWINKAIIVQHLYSPAMWSIFQMQDLLGISEQLRRENPNEERINQPADPNHHWKYRMHINLEQLLKEEAFNDELKEFLIGSGRD